MHSSNDDGSSKYTFEQVVDTDDRVRQEAALLAMVFNDSSRYNEQYLRWQYYENPDGAIVGYDAFDSETGDLAAHYVVQPLAATVFGRPMRGVLSLNTATSPSHQGRGLFVRLAKMTYDLAASQGYSFVVGVANANSTPGFVRKLGFQLVSQLDAYIGIGHPIVESDIVDLEFQRTWSTQARDWRMRRPHGNYWISGGRPYAKAKRLFRACLSAVANQWETTPKAWSAFTPLTVWIGLRPDCKWTGVRIPLPAQLRPSPLNFIFLPLSNIGNLLTPARVAFEAIDFDAY